MAEVRGSVSSLEVGKTDNRDDIGLDGVEISSNWVVNNHKSLRDAVTISSHHLPPGNDQIESTVTVDSCIQLSTSSDSVDEKCTITICCNPENEIVLKQMIVVSEANKIEVYTDHQEYYTTIIAEFIDKYDDDFIVYKGDISFQKPVSMCMIKFASLSKRTCFWLYGIRIAVAMKPSATPLHRINMTKICDRLQESDSQLTSRAEKFLHFMNSYNKTTKQSELDVLPKGLDSLTNLAIGLQWSQKSNVDSKAVDEVPSFGQGLETFAGNEPNTTHGIRITNCGDCGSEQLKKDSMQESGLPLSSLRNQLQKDFENVVKSEMQLLEERLWNKIDTRLQAFEDRQNKQLLMLNELLETLKSSDSRNEKNRANNNKS